VLCAEVAERVLKPAEPLGGGRDDAATIASELYRQSAYWSARSLEVGRLAASDAQGAQPDSVVDVLNDDVLARFAVTPRNLELLRDSMRSDSFVRLVELPPSDLLATCFSWRNLAQCLLEEAQSPTQALREIERGRLLRVLAAVLVIATISLGISTLHSSLVSGRDLARGKPWQASSALGNVGCQSPAQECAESPDFFFHTAASDSSPWLAIDLQSLQTFSAVALENRRDCCFERALPLVIEVSDDGKRWREVARRDAAFDSFQATFPATTARWVRVRLLRSDFLHLARIRVLKS